MPKPSSILSSRIARSCRLESPDAIGTLVHAIPRTQNVRVCMNQGLLAGGNSEHCG